jgi:hypothetical protein
MTRRRWILGTLLVALLTVDVGAQGPFTVQIQRAIDTLLTRSNAWAGTQTFTNVAVTGSCTGCGLPSGGIAGGIPYFSTSTSLASSAILPTGAVVIGGGAGLAPTTVAGLGTLGQVLTSNGPTAAPTWQSASSGAPGTATYIVQTANGSLPNAQALSTLATGYVKVTTATGVLSSQAIPIPSGDGGTGVANSATITVGGNFTTVGANTLTITTTANTAVTFPTTGTLVNTAVTALTSLASVGTITSGTWNGTTIAVANGGTGLTGGTSGGILYFSGATAISSSAALTNHAVVVGGGAGAAPVTLASLGTAGQVLTSNGAGVDPSWQAASGGSATVDTSTVCGRLTLTTGTPVTTIDVTAATTIYYTPVQRCNLVALYTGSAWVYGTLTEQSIALGTDTSGLPYSVFAYYNAGAVNIERTAWTNATTPGPAALVQQDGVYVRTGAVTRRFVATYYNTGTGQTEDSLRRRLVGNYYNREWRPISVSDPAASWSYTTAAWEQANANANNQVEVVTGVPGTVLYLTLSAIVNASGATNISFGEDSTTTPLSSNVTGRYCPGGAAINLTCMPTVLSRYVPLGWHRYVWLENGNGVGSATWISSGNSGMNGVVWQ